MKLAKVLNNSRLSRQTNGVFIKKHVFSVNVWGLIIHRREFTGYLYNFPIKRGKKHENAHNSSLNDANKFILEPRHDFNNKIRRIVVVLRHVTSFFYIFPYTWRNQINAEVSQILWWKWKMESPITFYKTQIAGLILKGRKCKN